MTRRLLLASMLACPLAAIAAPIPRPPEPFAVPDLPPGYRWQQWDGEWCWVHQSVVDKAPRDVVLSEPVYVERQGGRVETVYVIVSRNVNATRQTPTGPVTVTETRTSLPPVVHTDSFGVTRQFLQVVRRPAGP